MITPSKIHRVAKVKEPFKEWMQKQKALFDKKITLGKVPQDISFDSWINKKYESDVPVEKNLISDDVIDILDKTVDKITSQNTAESTTDSTPVKKTIFGLDPGIVYLLLGGITLVGGISIYNKIKK
jgi:hypothetical protein